jgi:exonuclease III
MVKRNLSFDLFSGISVASWNVQGLKTRTNSKLLDADFITNIVKHDIIFLSETHCNDSDNIDIDGYHIVVNHRVKAKKARKYSGGIIVAIRKDIRQGVKIVNLDVEDEITIKLCKYFFNFEKDVLIKGVYIPPVNSTYSKKQRQQPVFVNRFTQIKDDVSSNLAHNNFIVLGDMNGRTGTDDDGSIFDGINNDYLPIIADLCNEAS